MRNIFHFLFIVLFTIFTTSNSETEADRKQKVIEKFKFKTINDVIGPLLPFCKDYNKNLYKCFKDLEFKPTLITTKSDQTTKKIMECYICNP